MQDTVASLVDVDVIERRCRIRPILKSLANRMSPGRGTDRVLAPGIAVLSTKLLLYLLVELGQIVQVVDAKHVPLDKKRHPSPTGHRPPEVVSSLQLLLPISSVGWIRQSRGNRPPIFETIAVTPQCTHKHIIQQFLLPKRQW